MNQSYEQLIDRIREVAEVVIPIDGSVSVISKGDGELLKLGARRTWHFPMSPDGGYAGGHPADSQDAISHLEAARLRGSEYLLVPDPYRWWLEHYSEFTRFVASNYRLIIDLPGVGVIFSLHNQPTFDTTLSTQVAESYIGSLAFRCNICDSASIARMVDMEREISSCKNCKSTVRWRSVIHVLSVEMFGQSLTLPDFPLRKDLTGLGMSDWGGYARGLSEKFSYINTFYDQEPKCDIMNLSAEHEGKYDFIISSDVLEHVAPPVSRALLNVRRMLRKGGLLVLTVPYVKAEATIEHFPELYDYEIFESNGKRVLRNITRDGREQIFENLVFHGGPGATLEMRMFSERGLIHELHQAGFAKIQVYREPFFDHGVYWRRDWGMPVALRVD